MNPSSPDGYFERLKAGEPVALAVASAVLAVIALVFMPFASLPEPGTVSVLEMGMKDFVLWALAFAAVPVLLYFGFVKTAFLPAVYAALPTLMFGYLVAVRYADLPGTELKIGWFLSALAVGTVFWAIVRALRSRSSEESERVESDSARDAMEHEPAAQ